MTHTAISTTVQGLVNALAARGTLQGDTRGEAAHQRLLGALDEMDAIGAIGLDPNGSHGPSSPITLSAEDVEILLITLRDSNPEAPLVMVGTSSEPVQNQSPRRIEGGTEPGEPGTIAPLLFDESMLPAKALDEIEEIGRAMERAYDMALDSRLSRINASDRALAAIDRRWGNAPKGGV